MKYLLQLMASGMVLLLAACGDFYTFDESAADRPVSMAVPQDTVWLMAGDTMALKVKFSPAGSDSLPVFWHTASTQDSCIKVVNDTLRALYRGETDLVAVCGSGTLADTCHVWVIDRWQTGDLSHGQPSDMVVYARISIGGQSWAPSDQLVVAMVRGQVAGMAELHEAKGVAYALLRIWSIDETDVGAVSFFCYDRVRHRLYRAAEQPEFSALSALGTLSSLYPINF